MGTNKETYYPLLGFFQNLRKSGFLLGIKDYLVLFKALNRGFGTKSEDDLLNLCKMLWLKDIKEKDVFKELFDNALISEKGKLNKLLYTGEQDLKNRPKKPGKETDEKPQEEKTLKDYPKKDNAGIDSGLNEEQESIITETTEYETVYLSMGGEIDDEKIEVGKKQLNEGLGYVFSERNFLPYTERPLQIYWRSLKNIIFEPDFESIDTNACIEYISQKGILDKLFYENKPINVTNLVTIVDTGGSMKVFKWHINQLIGIISGEIKNDVYYCDNLPVPFLFSDIKLEGKIEWDSFYKSKLKNKYVIIISDGGAVKGNFKRNRIGATTEMLAQINQYAKNVVWLNPMPHHRWQTSSAIEISKNVKMFDTTYSGFLNAVNCLKNNTHLIPIQSDV